MMYFKCQRCKGLVFVQTGSPKENTEDKREVRIMWFFRAVKPVRLQWHCHSTKPENPVIFALGVL